MNLENLSIPLTKIPSIIVSSSDKHSECLLASEQGLRNRGTQMITKTFIDMISKPKIKRVIPVTRRMSVSEKDVLPNGQATFARIPAMWPNRLFPLTANSG